MTDSNPHMLFWGLLGLFTVISFILACSTLANVVRLRNVRMNWKAGRLKGYPLFSTLFLGFTLVGMVVGSYNNSSIELLISMLYFGMAGGWFVTSYLASKRYITDHGIVKNVNDPSQTVAWYQIRDFVETEKDDALNFVFIYTEEADSNVENLVRLELDVPLKHKDSFKKLISHKLGRRISCYAEEAIREEEFE